MRRQEKKQGALWIKNLLNLMRKQGRKSIIFSFVRCFERGEKSQKPNWKNGEKNLILIEGKNETFWIKNLSTISKKKTSKALI